MKLPGRIFISYRRSDTSATAGRLYDRLEARFGAGNVFMDVDSIEPGLDFAQAIEDAVGSCDVLLALIGTRWLDAVDEHGRRRLDDRNDFVALEITAALERRIRVIPVLVDGAAPPRRDDLPEHLAALARRQDVRLDHTTFGAGMTVLMNALERTLTTPPLRPTPDPPVTSDTLYQRGINTPARAVERDLLFGETEQRIAAVRELGSGRDVDAVPLLVRGFDATEDPDVSCRIIWALGGLGTAAARDALRTLRPRYEFEQLTIQDVLAAWREQPPHQGDELP